MKALRPAERRGRRDRERSCRWRSPARSAVSPKTSSLIEAGPRLPRPSGYGMCAHRGSSAPRLAANYWSVALIEAEGCTRAVAAQYLGTVAAALRSQTTRPSWARLRPQCVFRPIVAALGIAAALPGRVSMQRSRSVKFCGAPRSEQTGTKASGESCLNRQQQSRRGRFRSAAGVVRRSLMGWFAPLLEGPDRGTIEALSRRRRHQGSGADQ